MKTSSVVFRQKCFIQILPTTACLGSPDRCWAFNGHTKMTFSSAIFQSSPYIKKGLSPSGQVTARRSMMDSQPFKAQWVSDPSCSHRLECNKHTVASYLQCLSDLFSCRRVSSNTGRRRTCSSQPPRFAQSARSNQRSFRPSNGALLAAGAKLANLVQVEFELKIDSTHFWIDSTTELNAIIWGTKQTRHQTFVISPAAFSQNTSKASWCKKEKRNLRLQKLAS